MTGMDVTDEQMAHAAEFERQLRKSDVNGDSIVIRITDLHRLMAWYATVRIESGNRPQELGPLTNNGSRT